MHHNDMTTAQFVAVALIMLAIGGALVFYSTNLDQKSVYESRFHVFNWGGLVFGLVVCFIPLQAAVRILIERRKRK